MAESEPLYEIIQGLIDRRTEGTYWDFKRQHHENSAELIHDVLCLANADHVGDRYLIFGVESQTFTRHSIDSTPNRRTQADVITLLQSNSSKFCESRTPEVHLRELKHRRGCNRCTGDRRQAPQAVLPYPGLSKTG